MMVLITGSSASGKSAYGEDKVRSLYRHNNAGSLYYLATMICRDEESRQRIKRHQDMRRDKGFITLEVPTGLDALKIVPGSTLLLECLSNLLANEMFRDGPSLPGVEAMILGHLKDLRAGCENLVIISNEIFSDGIGYDPMTTEYIKKLGWLNHQLAGIADEVIEVVCGIPLLHKEAVR